MDSRMMKRAALIAGALLIPLCAWGAYNQPVSGVYVTIAGLGTGVLTALQVAVGSAGAFITNGGALGTPSSGTMTNLSGTPSSLGLANATGTPSSINLTNGTALPISTGVSGLGSNVAGALATAVNAAFGFVRLDGSGFQIVTPEIGVTDGSNAAAGNLGEVISSDIPVGSAVSASNATPMNVTSVSLTAGDWQCSGNVVISPAGSTTTTAILGWLSTTTAAIPAARENGGAFSNMTGLSGAASAGGALQTGLGRFNVSSPTTVFLSAQITFAVSTMAVYGYEACRRMR